MRLPNGACRFPTNLAKYAWRPCATPERIHPDMTSQYAKASVIYAEYILSRFPASLRQGFSQEQLDGIRKALIIDAKQRQSAVKLSGRIPLIFRTYYFVLMFGRDRRLGTLNRDAVRRALIPLPIRTFFYTSLLVITITAFGILAFVCLYMLKSALGIDIFPNYHLRDFVMMLIDWIT